MPPPTEKLWVSHVPARFELTESKPHYHSHQRDWQV